MSDDIGRRGFVRALAAMIAAAEVGFDTIEVSPVEAATRPEPPEGVPKLPEGAVVGVQMSPHTMLYEGIGPCLDLVQRTAAINVVMPYSHAFHTRTLGEPVRDLAADHGKPPKDFRGKVPAVWVHHHDAYFQDTPLRIKPTDPSLEFADRDLFHEMLKPCRDRGMKVYARVLEALGTHIENFDRVRTVDVYGNRGRYACWSNPDYRLFWADVVRDMFAHYDLDGFQWGAERMGPLMNVILPWNADPPTCFCKYCVQRSEAAGIDAGRAREGYTKLYEYVRSLIDGKAAPAEGVFTVFLRHLIRYPEILSWEYQYRLSREDVQRAMYRAIKPTAPHADVGWHIDQQPSSWDLVYRSEMSYEEMGEHADFLKPILYHAVLGPRIYAWYLKRFQKTILAELTLQESLALYYAFFGYDPKVEPSVAELPTHGFAPEYVYRETRRSVASANAAVRVYSGIGFDVPGSPPDHAETIRRAVMDAFRGGAAGIVVSREYEEMKVPHLKAVGDAIREMKKVG